MNIPILLASIAGLCFVFFVLGYMAGKRAA